MSKVFTKLNLKDRKENLVFNASESFDVELALLEGVAVHRRLSEIERFHHFFAAETTRFSGWRKPSSFAKISLCHKKPTIAHIARMVSTTIWSGYHAIVKKFWLGLLRQG